MNKFLIIVVCSLPFLSNAQEIFKQPDSEIMLQNQLPEELRNLIPNEGALSLHVENLTAEQGVKYLFPTLKVLFNDLTLITGLSENFSRLSITYNKQLTTMLQNQFRLTGNLAGGFGPPVSGVPPTEIFISSPDMLQIRLEQLASEIHSQFETEADKKNWDLLPFEFQSALVKFLVVGKKTEPILHNFFAPVLSTVSDSNPPNNNDLFEKLMSPWKNRQLEDFKLIQSIEEIDLKQLAFATRILTENLQSLLRSNGQVGNEFKGVNLNSIYGEITLLGSRKDTVTDDKFIIVDFGGDDFYANNCGSNLAAQNHVGLLIDYAGNDIYKNDTGFMNAAILGVSFLFDMGGDDKYIASKPGIAFSLFGTRCCTILEETIIIPVRKVTVRALQSRAYRFYPILPEMTNIFAAIIRRDMAEHWVADYYSI